MVRGEGEGVGTKGFYAQCCTQGQGPRLQRTSETSSMGAGSLAPLVAELPPVFRGTASVCLFLRAPALAVEGVGEKARQGG